MQLSLQAAFLLARSLRKHCAYFPCKHSFVSATAAAAMTAQVSDAILPPVTRPCKAAAGLIATRIRDRRGGVRLA
jgi:hypothetical protein